MERFVDILLVGACFLLMVVSVVAMLILIMDRRNDRRKEKMAVQNAQKKEAEMAVMRKTKRQNTWSILRLLADIKVLYNEKGDSCVVGDSHDDEIYAQALRLQCNEDCGDVYLHEDFFEMVNQGCITNYDGVGYLMTFEGEEGAAVNCSVFFLEKVDKEKYPFVIWFNK